MTNDANKALGEAQARAQINRFGLLESMIVQRDAELDVTRSALAELRDRTASLITEISRMKAVIERLGHDPDADPEDIPAAAPDGAGAGPDKTNGKAAKAH